MLTRNKPKPQKRLYGQVPELVSALRNADKDNPSFLEQYDEIYKIRSQT